MRNSLSPYGILIAHTLPAALLLFLYGSMLAVIRPLLSVESVELWMNYGFALVGITILATTYAVIRIRSHGRIHWLYGAFTFLVLVPLLWGFMEQYRSLVPWDVPRWMMPQDGEFYAIRLLSIPLAHAMFVVVAASLPRGARGKPLRDLLIALSIPLASYLFVQVVEPWRIGIDMERHVWVVMMVTLVVVFLFFLFRGVAAIALRTSPRDGWLMVQRFLVALLFPLVGLLLNNGVLENVGNGAFGDLGHWGFYTVALLNGLVVFWGSSTDPRTRFVQFILRAIGFSYVLYFFVLFLPFLPLSIVAIIAVGLGFLLLAPILLFLVQGMQLLNDIRFLRAHWPAGRLVAMLLLCMLVLPGIITARNIHHKHVLDEALAHVYQSDPTEQDATRIDVGSLASVLDHIRNNRDRGGWAQEHTPFLTPWYNYIVLDNLTLGEEKMADLERIFIGHVSDAPRNLRWWVPRNDEVRLDSVTTRSMYDAGHQAWRTWVDLEMTNTGMSQSEFVAHITLPPGAWISDEYLMIDGREVKGILAEKKAATWVYQQIVNIRRDPSITRYIGPEHVQLRVFPFAQQEIRHAGFEVLHKEPVCITLNDEDISIGEGPPLQEAVLTRDGSTVYIPSAVKDTLPVVERKAMYHLLVDGTEAQRGQRDQVLQRVERMMQEDLLDPGEVVLHIVDAYTTTVPWNEDAAHAFLHHAGNGGLFMDRAVRKVITAACKSPSATRPVIILMSSQGLQAGELPGVWLEGLDDLAACLPEGDSFFVHDGTTTEQRSLSDPIKVLVTNASITDPVPVKLWSDGTQANAYLRADSSASIALLSTATPPGTAFAQRDWNDALALEGRWRAHLLHPEGGTLAWRELVRGSFQAQVLTPLTAWMCLENDAQRNALLKKQEEVLNANAALDASNEDITTMSEPGMWWLVIPLLIILLMRRRIAL